MVQVNRQYERDDNLSDPITIKVVGVGGAGSNVLDRVMLDGIDAVEMVAINTDVQSLTASVATQKVQLGRSLTRGLGTGGDPELGMAAAEEAVDEIRGVLRGGNVIFICAGLGGGTGSGAAPLIAQLAKDEHALVLAFVAMPFSFEGRRRCQQAATSLAQLRGVADAVVCFENDRMAELTSPRMGIHEAFAAADLTISQSLRALSHLLQRPGLLRIGFDDVCAVLRNGDARALFGFGEAEGENRAHDALGRALKNPLMNRGELLADAYHAVVHICGGTSVTLGEVQIVMEELNRHINDQTQIFMGIGIDPKMGGRLSVSVLSSLGDGTTRVPAPLPNALTGRTYEARSALPALGVNWPHPALVGRQPGAGSSLAPEKAAATPASAATSPSPAHPEASAGPEEAATSVPPKPESMAAPVPKKLDVKQEVMQLEAVTRGRFEKSEPTIVDGQDLDVPTFLRQHFGGK
ncbi:MAG TPA: cell division protein FtsZ [Chthoniobacterales bacterium]